MRNMSSYVIGVDVGGTNTDAVVLCGRTVIAAAKRSTTQDKTSGIVNAISAALESLSEELREKVLAHMVKTDGKGTAKARVSIGTTHFTNAVAERDRARLARVAVIRLCGSASRALPPYSDFPQDLLRIIYGGAYMVSGGLQYNGESISPIDEEELRATVREILRQDPPVKNVVISGIFAPRDDNLEGQEARAAKIVQKECADISCTLSHKLGLLGLLERENACILNESLKPLAKMTIAAFRQALDKLGLTCPFYLTQNDGTLISADEATDYPVLTFNSGPTNSMRGGAFLSGSRNAIVVDIGGTTTDVGVLKDGFPRETSTQLKVGGVRTNFCMPDVRSISLGGGSHVQWDAKTGSVAVGPSSVGYRLTSKALCFGGQQCTTTDVAIAAGVAPQTICTAEGASALASLQPAMVYTTMREIRKKLENIIDSMKVEREDVLVLLVGGGAVLVDQCVPLRGASRVISPKKYSGVANAVGAALGTVSGSCDYIEDLAQIKQELVDAKVEEEGDKLDKKAREVAERRGVERAKQEAIDKGAVPESVYVHSKMVTDVSYVPNCLKVNVKAIGDLMASEVVEEVAPDLKGEMETEQPNQLWRPEDNPSWPNSSVEDSIKDEAAGLPRPSVQDHVWVLNSHDVECLAIGAGILGCGGGGDPNIGQQMALRILKEGKEIKIVNPFWVKPSEMDLLCPVATMGAPAVQDEKLSSLENITALHELQRTLASGVCEVDEGKKGNEHVTVTCRTLTTGDKVWVADKDDLKKIDIGQTADISPNRRRITGLFCGEVGGINSFEPLLVAAHTGLPVLDADSIGRAFPELQMITPFIYGIKPYPSVVADDKGEAIVCTHAGGAKILENFFRDECVRMGMSSAITLGVMSLSEVIDRCVLFSMSQAWQLGRAVMRAQHTHINVLSAVTEQQNGIVLITGKVLSVDRVTEGGFNKLVAVVEGLEDYAGAQVKILAKNENYIAQEVDVSGSKSVDGVVLACTPDLICVIDSDTGYPVTTESIRYGMRVGVLALPANHLLTTPEALAVVGPQAFDFNIPYTPPRPLTKRTNK